MLPLCADDGRGAPFVPRERRAVRPHAERRDEREIAASTLPPSLWSAALTIPDVCIALCI